MAQDFNQSGNEVRFRMGRTKQYAMNANEPNVINFTNDNGVLDIVVGNVPFINKGEANGVCPLNSSGQVPQAYLPSYVDDVIETKIIEVVGLYTYTNHNWYQPMLNATLMKDNADAEDFISANQITPGDENDTDSSKIYMIHPASGTFSDWYPTLSSISPYGGANASDINPNYKSPLVVFSPEGNVYNYHLSENTVQPDSSCIYFDVMTQKYYQYDASTNQIGLINLSSGKIYVDQISNKVYRYAPLTRTLIEVSSVDLGTIRNDISSVQGDISSINARITSLVNNGISGSGGSAVEEIGSTNGPGGQGIIFTESGNTITATHTDGTSIVSVYTRLNRRICEDRLSEVAGHKGYRFYTVEKIDEEGPDDDDTNMRWVKWLNPEGYKFMTVGKKLLVQYNLNFWAIIASVDSPLSTADDLDENPINPENRYFTEERVLDTLFDTVGLGTSAKYQILSNFRNSLNSNGTIKSLKWE